MRELKYAILGLINRRPQTGYDITRAFNDSIGNFWEAKHSQIYPELRRLMDEGLVDYEIAIQGEKLEKKVYTLTEKGREELREWLLTDEGLGPVPKDSFRLRIYFAEELGKSQTMELISGQLEKHRARLAGLQAHLDSFGGVPEIHTDDFSEYLLILCGVYRCQAYIDWIEDVIRLTKCAQDGPMP